MKKRNTPAAKAPAVEVPEERLADDGGPAARAPVVEAPPGPPPPPAAYRVTVNGGNSPGASIPDLDALAAIARAVLVGGRDRQVTLRVEAIVADGARVDGVR